MLFLLQGPMLSAVYSLITLWRLITGATGKLAFINPAINGIVNHFMQMAAWNNG